VDGDLACCVRSGGYTSSYQKNSCQRKPDRPLRLFFITSCGNDWLILVVLCTLQIKWISVLDGQSVLLN
jgi:hypothetical protein